MKIITQAKDKPIEVKTHANVVVQMLDIPNDDSVTNSTTTMHEGNQKTTTNMIREVQPSETNQQSIFSYNDDIYNTAKYKTLVHVSALVT